jgi:cytochrome b561
MTDQNLFDTATRIAAGDDGSNYDNVAISLHWATALLVVIQFGLAETWDWFAKPTQSLMQSLHVSFGVLLAAVIFARLVWRLIPGHRMASLEVGWMRLASKSVHYLLYGLVAAEVALGFLFRWSQGHPVEFFGLAGIPGPFGALGKAQRHLIKDLHNWLAWTIVGVAGLHALAALYHHYVLRDRILVRMLPRGAMR